MKIAIGQMQSTDDLNGNLAQAERLIEQAKSENADWIVLPENFALFSGRQYRALAEQEEQHETIQNFLKNSAKHHHIWIGAGTIPMMRTPSGERVKQGRVRSAALLIDAEGLIFARYDKMHLFDATVADAQQGYCESQYIEPGSQPVWCDTPFGRVGLAVCYDLRFPELFRYYAVNKVSMVLVPSAFTAMTGQAHWEVLLRARAIENLMVVVGSNQGGWHSKTRETWGHSMIVEPWGEVVGKIEGQGPAVVTTSIDLGSVAAYRKKIPVLEHRQFKLSY